MIKNKVNIPPKYIQAIEIKMSYLMMKTNKEGETKGNINHMHLNK